MGTVVDVKLICKFVIDSLAQGVILFHNHPSQVLKPSDSDITLTNRVKEALKLFDSHLLDHIIITDESFYSLGDEGIL